VELRVYLLAGLAVAYSARALAVEYVAGHNRLIEKFHSLPAELGGGAARRDAVERGAGAEVGELGRAVGAARHGERAEEQGPGAYEAKVSHIVVETVLYSRCWLSELGFCAPIADAIHVTAQTKRDNHESRQRKNKDDGHICLTVFMHSLSLHPKVRILANDLCLHYVIALGHVAFDDTLYIPERLRTSL